MEHEPNQTETPHRKRPASEAAAARSIEAALDRLDRRHPLIDTQTARLIAATLHAGDGSLLEHFAATGRLNPHQILDEISDVLIAGNGHRDWAAALAFYVEEVLAPSDDQRPLEFTEPDPEVYLEGVAGAQGAWHALRPGTSSSANELTTLPDETADDDGRIAVRNAVGFYGLDARTITHHADLAVFAHNLAAHGEAFATFAHSFGIEPSTGRRFRRRYVGSYATLTEFLTRFAESYGLLAPNQTSPATGLPVDLRLLERGLAETYLWIQGRSQLHVFSRAPMARPGFLRATTN